MITIQLPISVVKSRNLYNGIHCNTRAVADQCMFHKLRNNLANIAIPPILVTSVKHYCHYDHIRSLHSDAFKYQFYVRGVRLWNIIPYHLTTKPSLESFRTATFQWISPLQWCKHPGTNTWCLVQNSNKFLLLLAVLPLVVAVVLVYPLSAKLLALIHDRFHSPFGVIHCHHAVMVSSNRNVSVTSDDCRHSVGDQHPKHRKRTDRHH